MWSSYVRSSLFGLRAFVVLLALAGLQVANAATSPPGYPTAFTRADEAAFWWLHDQVNNVPLHVSPSAGTLATVNSSGTLQLKTTGKVPINNKDIVIDVAARVVPTSFARGVVNALSKYVFPLQVGVSIYDFIKELGYSDIRKADDGTMSFIKQGPSEYVCGNPTQAFNQPSTWCSGAYSGNNLFLPGTTIIDSMNTVSCQWHVKCGIANNAVSGTGTVTENKREATFNIQDLENEIASKSGWPTTSKAADAAKQILDLGEPLTVDTPTTSGPSSREKSTSTTTNPDGTTSTVTVTQNFTYQGDTINYTETTNNSNYNPVTNTTTNTTTQSTPTPDMKSDCEKTPDAAGCIKLGDTPSSDNLKSSTYDLTVSPVNFASSAGCPQPLNFAVMGHSYSITYQPICDRLIYLKVLFLAIAGFLAAYVLSDSFRVQA